MKDRILTNSTARWKMWALVALLTPSFAQAHVGAGQTSGVLHGLLHPVSGPDHVVAMLAVGLWAAQRGGRSIWIFPLSFVTAMSAGGLMGTAGISVPFVELGIVASVLILGLLVLCAVRLPLVAGSSLAGLFAVFHGHAHGVEMLETVSGLSYAIGFVLATGGLHAGGIGFGLLARQLAAPGLVRYAGGIAAAFGVYLLLF